MNLPLSQVHANYGHNIVQMRYANWEKDLFMGLMPNSQFGNSAKCRFIFFTSHQLELIWVMVFFNNQPLKTVTTNQYSQLG